MELVKSVKSPILNGRCIVASVCFTMQRFRREGFEYRGEVDDVDNRDWMYSRTLEVMVLPRAAKAFRVVCALSRMTTAGKQNIKEVITCLRTSQGNTIPRFVNIPSSARTLRSRIRFPIATPGRGVGCRMGQLRS